MDETRQIAAILVADTVGYSRLTGTDEEGPLAPQSALQRPDPTIAVHHDRTVKRSGDGELCPQTASSARRARMNAAPPAIRRAVGVFGSTTRQNGVTAWSPDSQALTAAAAISRNNLWVVTGQVASAPYWTAIDRRTAPRVPPPGVVGTRPASEPLRRAVRSRNRKSQAFST
jgi:hypothetical protein